MHAQYKHNCTIVAPVLFAGRSDQSGCTILSKNVAPLWEVQVQKTLQNIPSTSSSLHTLQKSVCSGTTTAGPVLTQNIH